VTKLTRRYKRQSRAIVDSLGIFLIFPVFLTIMNRDAIVVLLTWLQCSDDDSRFWWRETAPFLGIILDKAGYTIHSQYSALLFHFGQVVPHLGPRPSNGNPHWRSFMTDDFSPIEYSWAWESIDSPPKVRYSVEPIGKLAGSKEDPLNKLVTFQVLNSLRATFADTNLGLFDYFRDKITKNVGKDTIVGNKQLEWTGQDLFGFGFGFDEDRIDIKGYIGCEETIRSSWYMVQLLSDAMLNLDGNILRHEAGSLLSQYLANDTKGRDLQYIGVGIDCVEPAETRLKVYLRSPLTSIASFRSILTMGGRYPGKWSSNLLDELEDMYRSIISISDATGDVTRPVNNKTAGILYNFDIQYGSGNPLSKIYIPVRHYGTSDFEVARGLTEFRRRHGHNHTGDSYMDMLQTVCEEHRLKNGLGLQTYISVVPKNGNLAITAYLSPQMFSK